MSDPDAADPKQAEPAKPAARDEASTDSNVEKPKPDQKSVKSKQAEKSGQVAKMGNNFEIHCGERLPQYDSGDALAYRTTHKKSDGSYFAIICERHLVVRHRSAVVYAGIINPSLVPLLEENFVYWPPANQERYVFLYRDTLGKRLLEPDAPMAMGLKQEAIMENIVNPMVSVLQDFNDKDFVHGNICPSNMYDGGKGAGFDRVVLGDGLATPASSLQPFVFETIERSMADPLSRGVGTPADDLYAFGVSLAVILRSSDPLAGKSDKEIVRAKLEDGSYSAVTGKDRFTGSILELLRGLLIDDPLQRWSIDDVLVWMDGRRLSPKQALKETKAARPLQFDGNKYFQASFLAMDIATNPQETMRIVEGNELEQWIERSLEDEGMMERFQTMLASFQGRVRGPKYDAALLSRLSVVLHPNAPMRYRGLASFSDGIGIALADAIGHKKDVGIFAEFFASGIAIDWVTAQSKASNIDIGSLISRFDRCKTYVKQSKIGYGIERCLYLMAPDAPCYSEKIEGYYVCSSEDLIFAFEDLCAKGKAHGLFLDRHSIAFLAIKDPKSVDSYLVELQSSDHYKKVMGNLKCLATIQKRLKLGKLTELAQNFLTKLPVVYERYHDREVRDKLKTNIERFAAQGDLVKMAGLLDNVEVATKDMGGFKGAMLEYAELKKEHAILEDRLKDKGSFGRGTGKEVASLMSCALAAIVILTATFMFLSDNVLF